jgi:3-oxoacyl-[acyl-carrier-protein] synthase III
MIKVRFESIGAYVPEKKISNEELISRMKFKAYFDIERITGIKYRRWVSPTEKSYNLALNAAKECLRNSKYKATDIDIIIYTSITRSVDDKMLQYEPTMSQMLKKALGADSAIDFDITNACAGMLNGVYILDSMLKSGIVKNGMVVSGEYITTIADRAVDEISDTLDKQFASLTVGDAGAAVIMDNAGNDSAFIAFSEFTTAGEFSELGFGLPSEKTSGLQMVADNKAIHMEVFVRIMPILETIAKKYNVDGDEFDYALPHQTALKVMEVGRQILAEHFKTNKIKTLTRIQDFGNTASTSHFLVLYDMLKENKIPDNSKILFLVFASGIQFGCISSKIGGLKVKHGDVN